MKLFLYPLFIPDASPDLMGLKKIFV